VLSTFGPFRCAVLKGLVPVQVALLSWQGAVLAALEKEEIVAFHSSMRRLGRALPPATREMEMWLSRPRFH